jgi:hypothetical protein
VDTIGGFNQTRTEINRKGTKKVLKKRKTALIFQNRNKDAASRRLSLEVA